MYFILPFVLLILYYLVAWVGGTIRHDASLVDRFWGLSFLVLTLWVFLTEQFSTSQHTIFLFLIGFWAIRLSLHITIRNWKGDEDQRYQSMRKKHGPSFWWKSLFTVFMTQAILAYVISLPILIYFTQKSPTNSIIPGITIWVIGLLLESISDLQLYRFRKNKENKGKLFTGGLWRYSRHPNYFGEICIWWGIFLYTLQISDILSWASIISPLIMTYLLLKVSGVTLLEKTILTKKPGYEEYIESTNTLIPWKPRTKRDKSFL